jgi:uncharacterized LabA/DUF88 family protein
MRTIIYIDGFNLYYGALINTPFKWLDVVELFTLICCQQDPNIEVVAVKYFTAPVKAKIATHKQDSVTSQNSYHKALKISHPDIFQLIEGHFSIEKGKAPIYKKPLIKKDSVEIWKLEEKKTDVNIALNMYIDAQKGIEQIVLVSNDTDLVPAFEAIKTEYPEVNRATILPRKESEKARPQNRSISELSSWTRSYITKDELKNSQLEKMIPTKKKPVYKPEYW